MTDPTFLDARGRPRVVVTGMGAKTPAGVTVDSLRASGLWQVVTPDEAVEAAIEFVALPKRKGAFKRLLRRPGPTIALVYLVILGFSAVFARWVAPYDPNQQDIPNRLATPSWSHWLGTDDLGRDFGEIVRSANYNVVIGETDADVEDRLQFYGELLRKGGVADDKAAGAVEDLRGDLVVRCECHLSSYGIR